MMKTGRPWLLIAGGLLLAWTIWFWGADRLIIEDPPGHPAMPFEIREDVKLARAWGPFDRGSLRVVCTSANELRLVLQTLMPSRDQRPARRTRTIEAYEALLNVPGNLDAVLYVDGDTPHSLELPQVLFASIRSVDTIVSPRLSKREIDSLAAWMDETWRKRFDFGALEQGVFMHGFGHGNEIRTIADRCAGPAAPANE